MMPARRRMRKVVVAAQSWQLRSADQLLLDP